jgi:hypothetical protein
MQLKRDTHDEQNLQFGEKQYENLKSVQLSEASHERSLYKIVNLPRDIAVRESSTKPYAATTATTICGTTLTVPILRS